MKTTLNTGRPALTTGSSLTVGLGRITATIANGPKLFDQPRTVVTAPNTPGRRRAVRRGIGGKSYRRMERAARAEERRIARTVEAVEDGRITLSEDAKMRLAENQAAGSAAGPAAVAQVMEGGK